MSKSLADVCSKLLTAFHSMKNSLNVFYIFALVPLVLIVYYDISYIPSWMFGFLFLLLKRSDLSAYREANRIQRAKGLILILGSFIVYYLFLFPLIGIYGGPAIYSTYILGLFLLFFDLSALRETFTPIFIIVASTLSSFISTWLELHFSSSYIPLFTSLVGAILNTFGVRATTQYPDNVTLHTSTGPIYIQVIWGCTGGYGALVFSIVLITILSQEPAKLKTKMLWAVAGIIGTLLLNVIRVVIILMADYYYGSEVAGQFHSVLGYALFFTWLALFIYIFSRRQVILEKITSVYQTLRKFAYQ